MRAGELSNMKYSNLDFDKRQIHVRNEANFKTKTRRDRIIPMHRMAQEVLLRRHEQYGDEHDYVFMNGNGKPCSVNHMSLKLKEMVRKAGLNDDLHFHSPRHSFASNLAQSGMKLQFIQKWLGHARISTTEIYSTVTADGMHEELDNLL
jgi:integrase/recombinase XerC